jgi:hypothetical protein
VVEDCVVTSPQRSGAHAAKGLLPTRAGSRWLVRRASFYIEHKRRIESLRPDIRYAYNDIRHSAQITVHTAHNINWFVTCGAFYGRRFTWRNRSDFRLTGLVSPSVCLSVCVSVCLSVRKTRRLLTKELKSGCPRGVFCLSFIPSEYLFLCPRTKFGFNKKTRTKLLIVLLFTCISNIILAIHTQIVNGLEEPF